MSKTKTTVMLNDQLLKQFRDLAASKHGSSRMLSSEMEEALRAFSPLEVIRSLTTRLNIKIDQYPSLDEISRNRPQVASSAGKAVREMRDDRAERLLGHQ